MNQPVGPRTVGRRIRRLASRGLTRIAGAAALPLLPLLSRRRAFRELPARMMVAAEPQPSDLIHVLGGGHSGDYLRVDHGIALFHAGHAPRVLLTGSEWGIDWAERNGRRAVEAGIPESALIREPDPRSTRAEALALRRVADELGVRSVLLVTEAFHAGRAAMLMERALRGTPVELHSCPVPDDGFPPATWWEDASVRALVLGEVARLYLARATGDV